MSNLNKQLTDSLEYSGVKRIIELLNNKWIAYILATLSIILDSLILITQYYNNRPSTYSIHGISIFVNLLIAILAIYALMNGIKKGWIYRVHDASFTSFGLFVAIIVAIVHTRTYRNIKPKQRSILDKLLVVFNYVKIIIPIGLITYELFLRYIKQSINGDVNMYVKLGMAIVMIIVSIVQIIMVSI